MGRPTSELLRWNSLGAPLVPVVEDDREGKKISDSPAVSPHRSKHELPVDTPCDSLTCEEGSLSEAVDDKVQVEAVTSASLRLGLPVIATRPCLHTSGTVKTSGRLGLRSANDEKTRGFGTRSMSLGSGLSMLRARRPPSCKTKDSPYQSLMPLVLQTLGRLRYVDTRTMTRSQIRRSKRWHARHYY
jgi:hypothetical protein